MALAACSIGCLAPAGAQPVAQAIISTAAGDGTDAVMGKPVGMAFDSGGNLHFTTASTNKHQILRLEPAALGGGLSIVAGQGSSGSAGDGGQATAAQLSFPFRVAFDGEGHLYFTDRNTDRIRRVDAVSGTITTVAGGLDRALPHSVLSPVGLVLDGAGFAYVAESSRHRILKVQLSTGSASVLAGTGTGGASSDGTLATAALLNAPYGIALDREGNLYVAQTFGNRIDKVDMATGRISRVAGDGTYGFGGDGGSATATPLSAPEEVVADRGGHLFIADSKNHRIRMVDRAGTITTVAGTGTAGFSGDGGSANAAQLDDPSGLVFDSQGNLYVADYNNRRIRKITFEPNTLTFGAQAGQPTAAAGTFALSPVAAGQSTAPVFYRSTTPGVCTVSGITVSVVSTGTCEVEAVSPGDGVWASSAPTRQSMRVVKMSAATAVPTLSHGALLLLGGMLGAAALVARRSKQRRP